MALNPTTTLAAGRVAVGVEMIRAQSLDGRPILVASVVAFLDGLFEKTPCPQAGQFAFWTTPDGSQWLFVEREITPDGSKSYVVGRGDMGSNADEVTLSALGVVKESSRGRKRVKAFDTAALFVDSGGADAAEALKLEKRLAEGEFCSHVRTNLWAQAVRFTSFKDDGAPDGQVPEADPDGTLPEVETSTDGDAGGVVDPDYDDSDGSADDGSSMLGQRVAAEPMPIREAY